MEHNFPRIAEGNVFVLRIPQKKWNADTGAITNVTASDLLDLVVYIGGTTNRVRYAATKTTTEIRVEMPATLKQGRYSVWMTAKYGGRKVSCNIKDAFEIMPWSAPEAIVEETVTTGAAVYIIGHDMTDSELEALKEELQEKIDDAEDAKEDYETAKEEADAVAYEAVEGIPARFEGLGDTIEEAVEEAIAGASISTDLTPVTTRLDSTTYGLQAIKTAVDNIEVDVPTGIAMESNATANKNAIIAAIPSVPTDYAKETTAAAAKTASQSASALATIIDGKLASRNAANEPVNVGVAVGGVALSLGVDDDAQPLHDKVDGIASSIEGLATSTQAQTITTAIAAVAAAMYKGFPSVDAEGNITALPNQMYVWSDEVGNLTITKGAETEGIVNEYCFRFTGATSVVFSGWTLTWNGGEAPTWDVTKTYEISIVDNVALYAEV